MGELSPQTDKESYNIGGNIDMTTNRPLKVFLCHSSADKPAVRELYQKLRAEPRISPWLDEEELFPGMDWNLEIEKAIEATDVILVCLSNNSITKEGYVQREIRIALDYADYKPEGTLFIIPVRLEECTPPKRLGRWQYADYFEGHRERGIKRLLASMKLRADSLGLNLITAVNSKKTRTFEDVYTQAAKILQEEGFVSHSGLQKKLEITYTNAARIIDMMEEKNIVFSENGTLFNKVPDTNVRSESLSSQTINLEKLNNTQLKQKPIYTGDKLTLSNGMEFMRIPAGKFPMGSGKDNEIAYDSEKPQHNVDIPYDYWMAHYPVTNELYNAYTKAQNIKHPVDGWEKKKDHPVVNVTWIDVINYCQWLTGFIKADLPSDLVLRLPTEAEWEKAARGTNGREYPWGNQFDKNRCNTYESGEGGTTSVGQYSPHGDSPYGCADMSGNVWEWTHSLKKAYPYNFTDGREDEKTSGARTLRGGSFLDASYWVARCAFRSDYFVGYLNTNLGFRVVMAPLFFS